MSTKATYKDMTALVLGHGNNVCTGFEITKQNQEPLGIMALYFTRNKVFETTHGMDLSKGLLIRGHVGTGKTLAMRLFNDFVTEYNTKGFRIVAARHLVREYLDSEHGERALDRYGRKSFSGGVGSKPTPITICIDDIGQEDASSRRYGNESSPVGEVLLDRYECFVRDGMITHATTNLTNSQLEKHYGSRIYDRMREMFNVIKFEGESFRK